MATLQNKPGEPELQLKVEPESALIFKGKLKEEHVVVEVKITNTTKNRQAYKVKCTNNEVFRVCRPVGFLKPSESVTIKIMYNSSKSVPDPTKQYFALYHFSSEEEKKPPRELWKGNVKIEGIKRIPCTFEDTTDGGKEEDKKEEKGEEKSKMKEMSVMTTQPTGNAEDKKEDKEEKKEDEKKK